MLHVSLYLQYHVSQIIMVYHIIDVHNSCHLVMLQRNAKIETSIRGFHIQKYIAPRVEDTNEYETSEMRSGMCNPANPPYYRKHTKTHKNVLFGTRMLQGRYSLPGGIFNLTVQTICEICYCNNNEIFFHTCSHLY